VRKPLFARCWRKKLRKIGENPKTLPLMTLMTLIFTDQKEGDRVIARDPVIE
jgi:hypothetical protein